MDILSLAVLLVELLGTSNPTLGRAAVEYCSYHAGSFIQLYLV